MRAVTEQDFTATVAFAAANNLRLVVKATGHDWYGRSTAAGSLLLWTHQRKAITWHEAFVPRGSAEAGVPAVTVESGVQFSDLYPAAQQQPYPGDPQGRKTIVMGGTCGPSSPRRALVSAARTLGPRTGQRNHGCERN